MILNFLDNFFPKRETSWQKYADFLDIDPSSIIAPSAAFNFFFDPVAGKKYLSVGEKSQLFSSFNLLRPSSKIVIGKKCQLGKVNFNCAEKITVGDDVLMAWGITIIDNDSHSLLWDQRKHDAEQCYKDYLTDCRNFIKNKDWTHVAMEPIIIKNKVWIGFNTIILKGVTIEDGAVIGAGSVVTTNVPSYTVVAGNPARIVKKIEHP